MTAGVSQPASVLCSPPRARAPCWPCATPAPPSPPTPKGLSCYFPGFLEDGSVSRAGTQQGLNNTEELSLPKGQVLWQLTRAPPFILAWSRLPSCPLTPHRGQQRGPGDKQSVGQQGVVEEERAHVQGERGLGESELLTRLGPPAGQASADLRAASRRGSEPRRASSGAPGQTTAGPQGPRHVHPRCCACRQARGT